MWCGVRLLCFIVSLAVFTGVTWAIGSSRQHAGVWGVRCAFEKSHTSAVSGGVEVVDS